jgi:hypothetical protein
MNDYFWKLAKLSAEIAGAPILPEWIYCQWEHETGGFSSRLMRENHNLGGVCQTQPNDSPQPDGNQYYMNFDTYEDYARYFGKYLRYYRGDGIYEATNLAEYCAALKRGGYFGDALENYVARTAEIYAENFSEIREA